MNDFLQSLRNGQAEKPRTQKTRKNYDNAYHYTSQPRFQQSYGAPGYQNNRNQHMKRPVPQHQSGNQLPMEDAPTPSMLSEAIENLGSHIETLAKNQDDLVTAQERTADILERQTIAIEKIVIYLNRFTGQEQETLLNDETPPQKASQPKKVTPQAPKLNIVKPVQDKKPVKPVLRKKKKVAVKKSEPKGSKGIKLLSREAIMDIIQNMRSDGATFDQVASHLVELGQPTFSGRGEWHAQTIHRLCSKK